MAPESMFIRPVGEIASVLDSDVDMMQAVSPEHREQALHASRARVLLVERGEWDARHDAQEVRGGHGLLVLSGVLVRRVGITDYGAPVTRAARGARAGARGRHAAMLPERASVAITPVGRGARFRAR